MVWTILGRGFPVSDMSGGAGGPYEGLKIGRTLELARKERGLTLKQVEEATKIRARYLAEFERDNFGVLPAVYVQGSLKTYANFLHLDGETMVLELKDRQKPQEYPLYVGPPEDEPLDDILIAVGGAAAYGGDKSGRDEAPARRGGISGYLYVGAAAFFVLAVAAVLALIVSGEGGPAVSQVREPLISQAPQASPPGAGEDDGQPGREDKGGAGDEKEGSGPKDSADSKEKGGEAGEAAKDSETAPSEEQPLVAQNPATADPATATATATPQSAAPEREGRTARANADRGPSGPTPSASEASAPAPASVGPAASPASSPAEAGPTGPPPGNGGSAPPEGGGQLEVGIGGDDPVRLTGGPFDD